jgi:hypothetical protein
VRPGTQLNPVELSLLDVAYVCHHPLDSHCALDSPDSTGLPPPPPPAPAPDSLGRDGPSGLQHRRNIAATSRADRRYDLKRIAVPARGRFCNHESCFNLRTHVEQCVAKVSIKPSCSASPAQYIVSTDQELSRHCEYATVRHKFQRWLKFQL